MNFYCAKLYNISILYIQMERFLPKEGVVVATVYASITFPPCPTVIFKVDPHSGITKLVATGSLYQVNPDRIITKKIVLSGFPFKINKKSAVVRHMFFNRGIDFHVNYIIILSSGSSFMLVYYKYYTILPYGMVYGMVCMVYGMAWHYMPSYAIVWHDMPLYDMLWLPSLAKPV